jgi:hypothetical protein
VGYQKHGEATAVLPALDWSIYPPADALPPGFKPGHIKIDRYCFEVEANW